MKIDQISAKYFALFFLLVFFFPLLPTVFHASQIHVNFVILACSIAYLLTRLKLDLQGIHLLVLVYYLCCQMLLVPSLLNDMNSGDINASSIFSFFRPILLYLTYLSLVLLIEKCDFKQIFTLVKFVVFISFIYALFEVYFIDIVGDLIHLFYKRELRINLVGAATTFFGTTYYSGFVFFSLFVLVASRVDVERSVYIYLACIMAIVLVVLSQSKTMLLSLLISLIFISAFSSAKFIRRLFYVWLFFLIVVVFNINIIFDYLDQFNLTIVKQIKVLIYSTSKSETLSARSSQIFSSLRLINEQGGFFGVGLSPDKSLETWIALFLYRYGVLGIVNFLALCLVTSFYSLKLMYSDNRNLAYFGKVGLIWALTLPITQMSSAMLELGKTGFMANFILAIVTVAYIRDKNV